MSALPWDLRWEAGLRGSCEVGRDPPPPPDRSSEGGFRACTRPCPERALCTPAGSGLLWTVQGLRERRVEAASAGPLGSTSRTISSPCPGQTELWDPQAMLNSVFSW